MTIHYWLRTATQFLQSKSITTARLDAMILLEDTLRVDRAQLLAEPTREIGDAEVAHLQKLLVRRSKHEPLAYIRGFVEFYGRRFRVTPAVLVPRPESEAIIELLLDLTDLPKQPWIADVGTGSGALGITVAHELPDARVELLEIDRQALAVAQSNDVLQTTRISYHISDLLNGSQQQNDVLLCNLPYVPDEYKINRAAGHEPALALFGGADGLDLYRKLFAKASGLAIQPLYILTESLPAQHGQLVPIAAGYSYQLVQSDGYAQAFRHVKTVI